MEMSVDSPVYMIYDSEDFSPVTIQNITSFTALHKIMLSGYFLTFDCCCHMVLKILAG
jgi:hypothetical protein